MKVGVLGTGQLALMMAQASQDLDLDFIPFGEKGGKQLADFCSPAYGSMSDAEALAKFIDSVDVVTYESENTPLDNLSEASQAGKVAPTIEALKLFQHRLLEKDFFASQGLSTVTYRSISKEADIEGAAEAVSFPAVLKTVTEGYDGRGQCIVNNLDELRAGWKELAADCIMEAFISFDQEVSIVAVRDKHNNTVFYPLTENFHRKGQLRLSIVDTDHPLQQVAEQAAGSIMEQLNYVGCMTIEFFVQGDKLMVNEAAPRVHNSGHWTIDGADQSQFLLHVKAVAGEVISAPEVTKPVAMVNCIGEMPDVSAYQDKTYIKPFDYGKEPRSERKVGHINVLGDTLAKSNFYQTVASLLSDFGETSLADIMQDRASK